MRIGVLIQGLRYGGMEKMAAALSVALAHRGHDVTVYCFDDLGPIAEAVASRNVNVRLVQRSPGIDFLFALALSKQLRADRVELLHCHNDTAYFYGFLAARLAGVPVVYTSHSLLSDVKTIKKVVHAIFYRGTAWIVPVAEEIGDRLVREELAPRRKVQTIWNGIDGNRHRPRDSEFVLRKRAEWGIPPGARVVGSVGRLCEEKNQRMLLDLLVALSKDEATADVRLVLVGDGPLMEELDLAAREKGVRGNVVFAGQVAEVETVYPAFDIFALSSVREGMPLAIIEAMACALPVVSTDVGGIRNIVREGETGYLVPSGDVDAMADRVRAILSAPSLKDRLGRSARAFFEEHLSEEKMVDAYEDLFRKVVGR